MSVDTDGLKLKLLLTTRRRMAILRKRVTLGETKDSGQEINEYDKTAEEHGWRYCEKCGTYEEYDDDKCKSCGAPLFKYSARGEGNVR